MPALGVRSWFRLRSGMALPPKRSRYVAMIALQLMLLAWTALVAKQNNISVLGSTRPPSWVWAAVAAYLALVGTRAWWGLRKLTPEGRKKVSLMLPESPSEMRYWVIISFLAGMTEEYAYRGVVYSTVYDITNSLIVSLTICVLAFAIAHVMQGWRYALGAGLIALLCHLVVFLTQTLSVVIVFHIAYDLLVGALGMQALMRDTAADALSTQEAP
jgi:membrane protease YdiL (CAAX protease family)